MSIIGTFLEKRGLGPDAQMNFMEHVEVFRWHLIRSLIAIFICAIAAFINIDFIFDKIILGPAKADFISYKWLCSFGRLLHTDALCLSPASIRFQSTQLSGQFMMSFSSSFMIGLVIASPYVFWELWRFVKPALKKKELKYAKGIVLWTSLLFLIGIAFGYFLIAPFTISFFAGYQLSPEFQNIFTINNYYSTLSQLVLALGLVFELPVLVYFLSRLGLISPKVLKNVRRYAYVLILIVAAVITPPDVFSMMLVAIPLFVLYELSIVISGQAARKKEERLDW